MTDQTNPTGRSVTMSERQLGEQFPGNETFDAQPAMSKEEFSRRLAEAMKREASIDRPPMFHELMVSGADEETAMLVARMLRKNGYYLVNPDDIGWPEIKEFREDLRRGQDYREDAGGFFVRCILRLLGERRERDEVVTHQMAAKRLLQRVDVL